MIQNLLLGVMILLCFLLLVSLVRNPIDNKKFCKFKILSPKYHIKENLKKVCFNILVDKKHRYFINFPLLFKFYSNEQFRAFVKISYSISADEGEQILLNKIIEFKNNTEEYIVYITDIIRGKINIEILLDVEYGNPIIGFEILENNTCELIKEHKIELIFPKF